MGAFIGLGLLGFGVLAWDCRYHVITNVDDLYFRSFVQLHCVFRLQATSTTIFYVLRYALEIISARLSFTHNIYSNNLPTE